MIVNSVRHSGLGRALAIVLAVALSWSGAARADEGDSIEVEAQRLVHILGYTAGDYGGAVAGGVVVSESEYAEQLALLSDAGKIAGRIEPAAVAPPSGPRPQVAAAVARVRALVDGKASEEDVARAAAEARAVIVGAFRLAEAPTAPPDLAHGRALFTENCATCHGQTGHADTDRARSLSPHPADFFDPKVAEPLSPFRVASTVRFGINGTSMVPFTFFSEADRWDVAFFVMGLRHDAAGQGAVPAYTLTELATESDAQLRAELRRAGLAEGRLDGLLSDLRHRAPYEDRARASPLGLARLKLDRARVAVGRGETAGARASVVDAYLEGIEPVEGSLRAVDSSLVTTLEEHFVAVRGRLEAGAPPPEVDAGLALLLADVTHAEALLGAPGGGQTFLSTAVSSGGILLREGVEAALLIAALLGVAAQAGLADKRRYVHLGWASALVLGLLTWLVSSRLIALSGASRELVEGVTALLATAVLFYVSYSLLAKKEVARWMRFLRGHVSPRKAALSLFGVAFLAAYREAFETVLFYQALLSSRASTAAALTGVAAGAAVLVALVAAYSRAGRFAPPQVFFKLSSYLLYALAVVFAGQGVAALQMTGLAPLHPLAVPSVPALGLYPTVETCAAQGLLVGLSLVALVVGRQQKATPPPRPAREPRASEPAGEGV